MSKARASFKLPMSGKSIFEEGHDIGKAFGIDVRLYTNVAQCLSNRLIEFSLKHKNSPHDKSGLRYPPPPVLIAP